MGWLFSLLHDILSVDISPMSDPENRYLATLVINKIDDPVTPLSYAVTIGVPGDLFGTLRAGIFGNGLNSPHDALTIGLGAYCLELLRSRALDQ